VVDRLDQIELERTWSDDRAQQWWQLHSPTPVQESDGDEADPPEALMIQPTVA
jgi:hypothetical protein